MSKYILKYPADIVEDPILANAVLETGVAVNVLRANIEYDTATIVIDVPEDKEEAITNKFIEYGVNVEKLDETVEIDRDKCVDCGACIAVCPTEAIRFKDDWTIEVDEEECIRCGACVEACPTRALLIRETD